MKLSSKEESLLNKLMEERQNKVNEFFQSELKKVKEECGVDMWVERDSMPLADGSYLEGSYKIFIPRKVSKSYIANKIGGGKFFPARSFIEGVAQGCRIINEK